MIIIEIWLYCLMEVGVVQTLFIALYGVGVDQCVVLALYNV